MGGIESNINVAEERDTYMQTREQIEFQQAEPAQVVYFEYHSKAPPSLHPLI